MSGVSEEALPTGWAFASVEDLFWPLDDGRTLHQGWSPQCEKESAQKDEEWGVLKTTAIQAGAFLPNHNKRLPKHLTPRPHIEVQGGDFLMTCAGPRARCGVACLVRNTRPRLMMSGKMYRFRVSRDHFEARYLEAFLLTSAAQAAIDKMKTGGSDSGLNLTHDRFRRLRVPVAPLNEQRRIVSKIDELFSQIDEGDGALERVQNLVERYRQSVLMAAVTGRLTCQWRERHRNPSECGEGLLARILDTRRVAWETAESKKMKAQGIKPSNDKWKQRYREPLPPDTTDLPELPKGWVWASLGALITYGPQNGLYLHKDNYGNGTPIIRIDDYQPGWSRPISELQRVSASASDREKYGVAVGDFILNRVNSVSHLGKCLLVSKEHDKCLFESNLMRFRVSELISSKYLELHLRSEFGRRLLIRNCKHAVNQASINQEDVAMVPYHCLLSLSNLQSVSVHL